MSKDYWEKSYKEKKTLYLSDMESKLIGLAQKLEKGKVLDLGIGSGRNAIWFAENGFDVEGVDFSDQAIEKLSLQCIEKNIHIDLSVKDIRDLKLDHNTYDLIICSWILNFFKKSEVDEMIHNFKHSLKKGGYLYIGAFGENDASYLRAKENDTLVDFNTYYNTELKSNCFFMNKKYLHEVTEDLEMLSISEEEYRETSGKKRVRGIVEYLGQRPVNGQL